VIVFCIAISCARRFADELAIAPPPIRNDCFHAPYARVNASVATTTRRYPRPRRHNQEKVSASARASNAPASVPYYDVMTKPHLLGLALCLGLATGCSDEQKPAPTSNPAPKVATTSRDDRGPAAFTDEDRAVIAYLDAWEPQQEELRTEFTVVRKRASSTRIDIARHRDADPKGACDAITALIDRDTAWHRDHALPAPLTTEKVFNYESSLRSRHTGKGDDLQALATRVDAFHDHRDDFSRRSVFELNQQLENLHCADLK
jgi:hypothetical protein